MDFAINMTGTEKAKVQAQVEMVNTAIKQKGKAGEALSKDDFMSILITQLTHQDPTAPMEDKEFIAQMAQFSALEQMTNMSAEFSKLSQLLSMGQVMNLIGKTVDVQSGDSMITGIVQEVSGREFPQVLVNGTYYDYSQVEKIRQ
ncbi:MAG: flagellar hook assembly protein FlgD [Spirochaetales bacterium]|nr:MAG: flagellar hook assembly protein FlgD [Spirochaetales bacterium]